MFVENDFDLSSLLGDKSRWDIIVERFFLPAFKETAIYDKKTPTTSRNRYERRDMYPYDSDDSTVDSVFGDSNSPASNSISNRHYLTIQHAYKDACNGTADDTFSMRDYNYNHKYVCDLRLLVASMERFLKLKKVSFSMIQKLFQFIETEVTK